MIELSGFVVKAGILNLTGDDRAIIFGAMIWIANKLKSEDGKQARGVCMKLGKIAFEAERTADGRYTTQLPQDRA